MNKALKSVIWKTRIIGIVRNAIKQAIVSFVLPAFAVYCTGLGICVRDLNWHQGNIRYGATPAPDEIAFDMPNAEFSHRGELCTFEVMLQILDLDDPVLQTVAEIVHDIDLRDKLYLRPETSGIDAVLNGWQHTGLPDSEMETRGLILFEGLYVALAGSEN